MICGAQKSLHRQGLSSPSQVYWGPSTRVLAWLGRPVKPSANGTVLADHTPPRAGVAMRSNAWCGWRGVAGSLTFAHFHPDPSTRYSRVHSSIVADRPRTLTPPSHLHSTIHLSLTVLIPSLAHVETGQSIRSQKAGICMFGNKRKKQIGDTAADVAAGDSSLPLDDGNDSTVRVSDDGASNSRIDEEAHGMRNYGATEEADYIDDNHRDSSRQLLGMDMEFSESDASSQYSTKMGVLSPEDRKAGNDAERYLHQSMLSRAYPERTLALLFTLLLELPTLFIISGGSDKLCALIGRRRYQLLVAFLPLTSAISGNVGLQASTLTTRAVSHLHITKHSYCVWLIAEVGTAAYQGLGMGAVSGLFAYVASGHDFAFGITIFLAQFISILTAGFTGTMAPLIFTFLFQRDSGQWGGPLETAIQDIVGSFAMVVLSYHVLNWLGPHEIHESDVC